MSKISNCFIVIQVLLDYLVADYFKQQFCWCLYHRAVMYHSTRCAIWCYGDALLTIQRP